MTTNKQTMTEEILDITIRKYWVTQEGVIFNRKTRRPVNTSLDHAGYPYFSVYIGNGISKKVKVHRAVAFQYLPNPDSLPQVNHKDGNRSNNHVTNLEWCDAAYNVSDGFSRGRIVWNKGNASKARIYGYCKKYPRQIFWILSNNDFQFAKAFFGEEVVCNWCGEAQCWQGSTRCSRYRTAGVENKWIYCLKELALTPDNERLAYLAKYLEEHE